MQTSVPEKAVDPAARAAMAVRRVMRCGWAALVTQSFIALALVAMSVVAVAQNSETPAETRSTDGIEGPATRRVIIRFLTTTDFPPFNAPDEDGQLAGLNVDLARAICLDLAVTCDIRVRPWEDLIPAIERGEADALIAGHAMTAAHLARLDFTLAYFNLPARFAIRTGTRIAIGPESLAGRRVGVARGTAHSAYLKDFFSRAEVIEMATPELARDALVRKEVDAIFDDGVSLAFWVNGALSRACCELAGGPYFEPRYFGNGLAIAVKKGDRQLRASLDGAIQRLRTAGRLEELIQRHFPIRVY